MFPFMTPRSSSTPTAGQEFFPPWRPEPPELDGIDPTDPETWPYIPPVPTWLCPFCTWHNPANTNQCCQCLKRCNLYFPMGIAGLQ